MNEWLVSLVRRAYAAASIGWGIALPLASWLANRPPAGGARLGYALALATYAVGSLVCHQRPERSFFAFGVQMPVCARCAGLYAGAAVAAALLSSRAVKSMASRAADTVDRALLTVRPDSGAAKLAVVVSCLPTAATLLYEWTTGHMPAHGIRALAGAPLGAVISWVVCAGGSGRRRNQVG